MEKNELKYNKIASFSIVVNYLLIIFKNIFVSTVESLIKYNNLFNYFLILMVICFYGITILFNYREIKLSKKHLLTLLFMLLLFSSSIINNYEIFKNSIFLDDFITFIAHSLPIIIFLPTLSTLKFLLDYFIKISKVISVFSLIPIVYLFLGNKLSSGSIYSMSFGRNIVVIALFLIYDFVKNRSLFSFLMSIIIIMSIILFGSRFPLLIVGSYIILLNIFREKNKKKIIFLYLLIFLILLVVIFGNYITNYIGNILIKYNIQSRTLNKFISGSIGESEARKILHNNLILGILKKPLIGYGLGGGFIILKEFAPHSLLLDIFATFGIYFGSIILIYILIKVFVTFKNHKEDSLRSILLIMIVSFLPIATIQLSLWNASSFWFMISILIYSTKEPFSIRSEK